MAGFLVGSSTPFTASRIVLKDINSADRSRSSLGQPETPAP